MVPGSIVRGFGVVSLCSGHWICALLKTIVCELTSQHDPLLPLQVASLSKGSVIAEVVLHTPSSWTAAQVNAVANTLSDPSSLATIFDPAFLDVYSITGVTVQVRMPYCSSCRHVNG